jgi:hypothetical protein
MSHNRVLVHPDKVRALFAKMRDDLHEMAARHASEVATLRAELDEVRAQFEELRSLSLARQNAEAELRELYRERGIHAHEQPNATPTRR